MWTTWEEINHKLPNAAVTCVTSAAGPRDGGGVGFRRPTCSITTHHSPFNPSQSQHIYSCKDPRQRVSTASSRAPFPFFLRLSRGPVRHRPGLKARWSRGYGLFATVAGTKTEARGLFPGYCKATQVGLWRRKGKTEWKRRSSFRRAQACFSPSSSFGGNTMCVFLPAFVHVLDWLCIVPHTVISTLVSFKQLLVLQC